MVSWAVMNFPCRVWQVVLRDQRASEARQFRKVNKRLQYQPEFSEVSQFPEARQLPKVSKMQYQPEFPQVSQFPEVRSQRPRAVAVARKLLPKPTEEARPSRRRRPGPADRRRT